ncbi:hypothetical protein NL676_025614 [Syzygium grande]|nr:hypothetical protein NL676_025614 [Syzygium grande]
MDGANNDEEENLNLVANACNVLEHMELVMSKDLLHKFRTTRPPASTTCKSRSGLRSSLAPTSPIDFDCLATPKKLYFGFAPYKTTEMKN